MDAVARELRRVVSEGGAVLIRGAFAHHLLDQSYSLYRFFPEIAPTLRRLPRLEPTVRAFQRGGFSSHSVEFIEQVTASNLAELYERAKVRADTALARLTDEEFTRGLERLGAEARVNRAPVIDSVDLVTIR